MTIDEAIEKAKKVAENNRRVANFDKEHPNVWNDGGKRRKECEQRAQEHEQLVEWLEEYKALKVLFHCSFIVTGQTVEEFEESVRNKVIDDFTCYIKHEEAEGNIKTLEDYDKVAEKFRKKNHKG